MWQRSASGGGADSPLPGESEKLLFADFVGFQALLADCGGADGGSLLRSHGSGFPAENASRHRHDRSGADPDGLMCFGLYPALAATVFAPRAMYGFGVLLTVFGMTAAEEEALLP